MLRAAVPVADALTTPDTDPEAIKSWFHAEYEFHATLARCQDNRVIQDTLAGLNQAVLRFRYVALALTSRGRDLVLRHDDLLEAIGGGIALDAKALIESEWRQSELNLVEELSAAGPVQEVNVWGIGATSNTFYLDATTSSADPILDVVDPQRDLARLLSPTGSKAAGELHNGPGGE